MEQQIELKSSLAGRKYVVLVNISILNGYCLGRKHLVIIESCAHLHPWNEVELSIAMQIPILRRRNLIKGGNSLVGRPLRRQYSRSSIACNRNYEFNFHRCASAIPISAVIAEH